MFALLILLVVSGHVDSVTAAVTCSSDRTIYCFVSKQTVLANEPFQISRSTDVPVTTLIISESDMPVISATIFTSYPNLTFLSIDDTGIKQITFRNFANAGKLQKLYISNNFLPRITNATFRSCTSLQNLQLNSNGITIVQINAFQALANLTTLSLSNNSIVVLQPLAFQNLPNLQTLTMSANNIKKINPKMFQMNPKLLFVDFSNNQLTQISPDLFKLNPQLGSIYFNQNFLVTAQTYGASYVDYSFNRLTTLQLTSNGTKTLQVHDNYLQSIQCSGTDLSSLTRLYASNNSLTSFNCISDMNNLTELDMTSNKFNRPTQDVFVNLLKLRIFSLFNQTKFLKATAKSFAPLQALQSLRIDRLVDYRNLQVLFPKLYMLSLTTRTWNCSYTGQVAKALTRQQITMNYNNQFDRSICNVKQAT